MTSIFQTLFILHLKLIFIFVAFFLGLCVYPGLKNVDYDDLLERHPPPFSGPLAPNDLLASPQKLFLGSLSGPESFAERDGWIYTGVQGGDVIRFDPKHPENGFERVTRVGGACAGQYQEHICGRVLGLDFDSKGDLILADCYYGLYKYEINTRSLTPLVPSDELIDGAFNLLTNSLTIAADDTIYFTTSSTLVSLNSSMVEALRLHPSGRVMRRSPDGTISVLLDGVPFANGIQLSSDESFFVFNSVGDAKVFKYVLRGPEKGQLTTFFDPPGIPDNVSPSPNGGFYVGVLGAELPGRFPVISYIRENRWLAIAFGNLIVNSMNVIQAVDDVVNATWLKKVKYYAGNTETGALLARPYALIVELNRDGGVVASYQSDKIAFICEGFAHDGWLYLGSPYPILNYVARVPISPRIQL